MEKKYRELFDSVRASERLRTEVMHMKREKPKRIRRIPMAALAAVLALALAGTAVAAERFGWIRIEPVSGWQGPDGTVDGSGYTLTYGDDGRFPAESLSEEVFAIGEEAGGELYPRRMLFFDSWQDCEEFLGVELADNPRLDRMEKDAMQIESSDGGSSANAYVWLGYVRLMPSDISVTAGYREKDAGVIQTAHLSTQYGFDDPEQWDFLVAQDGEEPMAQETYTTSNGTQAVILTDTCATPAGGHTSCYAFFSRNNVRFTLDVSVKTHDRQKPAGAPDALELMKEILDAYE